MEEYWDVDVIVEGALDASETFTTEAEVEAFVGKTETEATADGLETEVYVQYHGHELSEDECSCSQYETDHHPDYAWNSETRTR